MAGQLRRKRRGGGGIPRAGTQVSHFPSVDAVVVGSVVYDRGNGMVGVVLGTTAVDVTLKRPTGYEWRTHYWLLLAGTAHDQHQLVALAGLHRTRLRGRAG